MDKISPFQFEEELGRVKREFKGMFLTEAKTAMIWRAVKDLPVECLTKVIDHMIASFRRVPVVQDFVDGLAGDRRLHGQRDAIEPFRAKCHRCNDIGVVMGTLGEWDGLTICKCDAGKGQPWALPTLEDLGVSAKWMALPHEMFVPKFRPKGHPQTLDEADGLERSMGSHIRQKAIWWRETIRIAEENYKVYLQNQD